jgi:imidazolonepropionase-like amidohydrolase
LRIEIAVASVVGLAACGATGEAERSPDLAVAHVDVLDVRSGALLRDRTVLVDGGAVVAVDSAAGPPPAAARVLNGAGGLLIPGFVDAHSHLAYVLGDSLSSGGGLISRLSSDTHSLAAYRSEYDRQYLTYGVTAVRDTGSSSEELPLLLGWMRDRRPSSPDVYPSGGALVSREEGRVPFPGHRVVNDPEDAVAAVRAYHDMGIEHVKLYWRLREPEFAAALAEAQRLGMHPTGHVDFQVLGIDRALDLGLRSFEHAYTLGAEALSPTEFLAAWREDLPRSIGDRQNGRFYLGAMEYFQVLGADDPEMTALIERLAATRSTVVQTLHLFAQRLGMAPYESRRLGDFDDTSGLTPAQLEHAREGYRIMAEYVRRMHEAGVRLAVGTDWIDPGRATLSETRLLHEAGIPMADALRAATLGGAEALGIDDRVGALEAGLAANLVLLHRNPLDHPSALLGPRTVIKDGVVVVEDGPPVTQEATAPAR